MAGLKTAALAWQFQPSTPVDSVSFSNVVLTIIAEIEALEQRMGQHIDQRLQAHAKGFHVVP